MKRFVVWLCGALLIIAGVFTSCDKSEELVQTSQSELTETRVAGLRAFPQTEVLRTRFPIYHWFEWSGRTDTKGLCGETAYMVALKSISQFSGSVFELSLSTQNAIDATLKDSPNPYDIYNHWKRNYSHLVKCDFARGKNLSSDGQNWTTRSKIKEFIENALRQEKIVLMPVLINGRNPSLWRNDAISTKDPSYERENYISKFGNIGHWLVIYRLDIDYDSKGNVIGGRAYYSDVLSQSASDSKKVVNYSRLLDANLAAGSTHSAMWFDSL